jgi:hypothetical protein
MNQEPNITPSEKKKDNLQAVYLEWLRKQYSDEVQKMSQTELLAKLSELRRTKQ